MNELDFINVILDKSGAKLLLDIKLIVIIIIIIPMSL